MANPIPQVGGAVAAPEPVVKLEPSDREARLTLEALQAGGRAGEGSPLGRVLEDDTFATMSFGALCLEQGLPDEAAQIFLRLVKKNPGDARVRERLDEALRAKTQKRKG